MIYAVIVAATALLFLLAVLALDSYRKMRGVVRGVNGAKEPELLEYAREEAARALMRASGWTLFFFALLVRTVIAEESALRSGIVLALVLAGCLVFLAEALRGRRERERMFGANDRTVEEDIWNS